MNGNLPDPNDPRPTPANPNPAPARPAFPAETPQPDEPPGVPPPTPDPIPSPGEEPIQIPPGSPPEVPSEPGFPAPTATRMAAFVAAGLLLWSGSAGIGMAQTPDGTSELETPGDRCRVELDDRGNNAGLDRGAGSEGADQRHGATQLSLEDCSGVLVPPKIGDQEIVEPPPNTGTTPVIPPGAVPEQPADPEQ